LGGGVGGWGAATVEKAIKLLGALDLWRFHKGGMGCEEKIYSNERKEKKRFQKRKRTLEKV